MMYLEKALLHLDFLQAAMLMIDKTFKGRKLICLPLAGLRGHAYIHPTKCFVCFSTLVSLGLWTTSQDMWLNDKSQLTGCSTEYYSQMTDDSFKWDESVDTRKKGGDMRPRGEEKKILQHR